MSPPAASRSPTRASRVLQGWLPFASAWALVVLAAIHLLARFNAQALDVSTLFSADNLYLPSLYRDLFEEGGRWAGWKLTPAPYFFPDMGLYFALDALTGPVVHALVGYALAQCVLLGLAAQWLARTVAPHDTAAQAQALAVGVVAALLLACAEGRLELMQYAALNATHFSLVPLVAVALALLLRAVRDRSRLAPGALALLCVLASASDSLFVVTFTAPALLCLGGMAWLGRPGLSPRWVGSVAGLVLLATVVGSRVPRWLSPWRTGGFTRARLTEAPEALGRLVEAMGEQFQASPAVGMTWVLLVLLAAGCVVSRRAWAAPGSERWALYALCLFIVLVLGTTLGAVVLTGQFENKGNFRYLLVPALLPFLLLAFLPALLQHEPLRRALSVGALGLVAAALAGSMLRHPWRAEGPLTSGFHPPLVECLDARRARHGLGWGVADYWVAKLVTTFSRTGLRVHQVLPDGRLYHWINNLDWYLGRRGDDSDYTFVITQGLSTDAFTAKYGAPREVFHCGGFEVFLYGRDLDAPLRAQFARETKLLEPARAGGEPSPTGHARPE
ncbi:hypothetical protein [Myxococcus sp. Y35]|uniref:hypothetical protein n=1 Tax=Pseudomyxococcus flavus TaxID=3115648 RepID=UPI003CF484A8